VLFGIGSLSALGALALRSRLRLGAGVSVLILAISPLLVSVTAYARPYALPLFLSLTFLLATDVWLVERRIWSAAVLTAAALLLPLSRTIEPNLVLGGSIVVLGVWKFAKRPAWNGSPWLPVGAASVALMAVGIPILMRLREELAYFSVSELVRLGGLTRWFTDIPHALSEVFTPWPLFLAVVIVALILPGSRGLLTRTWWFWVLAFVPLAFATVFAVRTPSSQAFYIRYTFTWWPPFALMAGAIVDAIVESPASLRRTWRVLAGGLVVALIIWLGVEVRADLSDRGRPDFEALGTAISTMTTPDTTVLFDSVRLLGSYRTPFRGRSGRYLDRGWAVPLSLTIAKNPDKVSDSGPIAVALIDYPGEVPGWPIEVSGWQRIETGPYDNLYVPINDLSGRQGARTALVDFAEVLGPDRGAALALAAATLASDDGDGNAACSILAWLRTEADDSLLRRIDASLAQASEGGAWAEACHGA
jgi:hypothetical protein